MLGGNPNEILLTDTYNFPQMFRQSSPGSSDLGDVSWIAPLGQVLVTCAPLGVQVHTWQATASFGTMVGMKGMHYAAKTMAGAALDTLLNPDIIAKAKEELNINSEQITLLQHMILSHHGQLEYGSPVLPLTKEALLLPEQHYRRCLISLL